MDVLAHHLQGVGQGSQDHHGGAVLVIVEDGDGAALLQLPLDLKAPWGGNILQIDPAEAALEQGDGVDDLIHVLAVNAQGHSVHAAKGFEQDAFALHHRHPSHWADVTQPQHSGAIGDHSHRIATAGEGIALCRICLDLQAGLRHTWGIGQRERLLVMDLHLWHGFQLSVPLFM